MLPRQSAGRGEGGPLMPGHEYPGQSEPRWPGSQTTQRLPPTCQRPCFSRSREDGVGDPEAEPLRNIFLENLTTREGRRPAPQRGLGGTAPESGYRRMEPGSPGPGESSRGGGLRKLSSPGSALPGSRRVTAPSHSRTWTPAGNNFAPF